MFGDTTTSSGNSTSNTFGAPSIFLQNNHNGNLFGTGNPFGSTLAGGPNSGTSGTIFVVRHNGGTSAPFTSSTSSLGFSSAPAFTSSTSSLGFSSAPAFTSSTSSLGFSSAPAFTSSASSLGFSSAPAFTSSASSLGFSSAPASGPFSSISDSVLMIALGSAGSQVTTPLFPGFVQFNISGDLKKGSKVTSYRETGELELNRSLPQTAISISAMPEYQGKSHEELRWEDCQFNSKGESCWGMSKIESTNPFSPSKPVNPFNPSTLASPFNPQPISPPFNVSPFSSLSLANFFPTPSFTPSSDIFGPSVMPNTSTSFTPISQSTMNPFSLKPSSNPVYCQVPSSNFTSSTAFSSPFSNYSTASSSILFSPISQPSNSFQLTSDPFSLNTSSNHVSGHIPSFNFTSPTTFTSPLSNSSTTVSSTIFSPFSQPNNSSQLTANLFSFNTGYNSVSSLKPSFNYNGSTSSISTPSTCVMVSPTSFQPSLFPSPSPSFLTTLLPSPSNSTSSSSSISSVFSFPYIPPITFTHPPTNHCTGMEQMTAPLDTGSAQCSNSRDLKKGSKVVNYQKTAMLESGGTAVSISAMPEYCDKSHEEVRWEDCQFNSKGESCWGMSKQSMVDPFLFNASFDPASSQIPSFNCNGSTSSSISTPSTCVKVSPTESQPDLFPSPALSLTTLIPSPPQSTSLSAPISRTSSSISSAFSFPCIPLTTFTQPPPPPTQCTGIEQPSPAVIKSTFDMLPTIPPVAVEHPGQVIQQGISSMPIQNDPAPVRHQPLLSIRILSQRKRLPLQKYHPELNGPKVPSLADDKEIQVNKFLPRENPGGFVISLINQCAYSKNLSAQKPPSSVSGNGDAGKRNFCLDKLNLTEELTREPIKEKRAESEILTVLPKLQLPGYYTEPRIAELAVKEKLEPGFCSHVKDFVIGRHGYGSIKFYGETDVRNLDLGSCVQFNMREVIVYMDEIKKLEVGEGLNKPAELTLLNIECFDKKTGKRYIDGIKVDKFKEMLMKKAAEEGAEFVSYDPVGGEWKFRVQHF